MLRLYGRPQASRLSSVCVSLRARPVSVTRLPRHTGVVKCYQEDKNPQGPKDESAPQSSLDKVVQQLKQSGLTPAKAKEALAKWTELGVKDEDQLRKLLVQKTLQPLPGLGIQTALDALACFGGFYVAGLLGEGPEFPGQFVLQILASFAGFYYFLSVMLQLSVVSTILFTAFKYGTNSSELLAAVQVLAGPAKGGVLGRTQELVNTLKVLQTLDCIVTALKDISLASGDERTTLANLSAYLTLAHAKQKYGFDPDKYKLSEKEAGDIAFVFSKYDINDDFRLELSEIGKLCQDLGQELSEGELKEAIRILDNNKNGFIEFEEFVDWWVNKSKQSVEGCTI